MDVEIYRKKRMDFKYEWTSNAGVVLQTLTQNQHVIVSASLLTK